MIVHKNYSLKKFNTFGFDATAETFAEVNNEIEAKQILLSNKNKSIYILGGGSNVLFTKYYYDALFIKNNISGINIVRTDEQYCICEIGGGENWHSFVLYAIENNLGGVENLSLIPGTVGAAPIQNIGAYGVELKDIFESLEAIDLKTLETKVFNLTACQFGYRDSIFKTALKGQFLISKVNLKLTRAPHHTLKTDYGDLKKILAAKNISAPTIREVSDAVIHIRQIKLPDPKIIGNAGSFFKNPEIPVAQFESLKIQFPNIVGFKNLRGLDNLPNLETVKVAAGWLIEQAGWKGKRIGDVGVHAAQALVLVNYGNGKSSELIALAAQIQSSVFEKFGIALESEVNFV